LLPKPGSKERESWDLVAKQYEGFLQKNAPERLELMGKVISYEDPVNFGLFAPQTQAITKPREQLMRA
jgi:hypothetical protein